MASNELDDDEFFRGQVAWRESDRWGRWRAQALKDREAPMTRGSTFLMGNRSTWGASKPDIGVHPPPRPRRTREMLPDSNAIALVESCCRQHDDRWNARHAAFRRPDAARCCVPLGLSLSPRLRDRWRHESRYVPVTHRSPRPPRPARRQPAEPPPEPLSRHITARFRHLKMKCCHSQLCSGGSSHLRKPTRRLAKDAACQHKLPTDPLPLNTQHRLVSRHPDMPC
jgi:hypothetical protein